MMTREASILKDFLLKCEQYPEDSEPVQEFTRQHPTDQQQMLAFMIDVMLEMQHVKPDGRNQAAVDFCKKVVASTTPRDRAMPYI